MSGDKDVPDYIASANAWNNGQDIALPNTADIKLATEARGTDPFTPFVEHQDKYIVLLATGGTLTSLAQADTGSLAGGAQMEVWREIVSRDGVLISDAFNRGLFRRYLECAFPGQPIAAEFRLSNDKQQTASEIADLAGKLKVAGWRIKQEELEEAVGYALERDESSSLSSSARMEFEHPLSNSNSNSTSILNSAPFMNKACNGHSNDLKSTPKNESGRENDVLTAFSKDNGPAAEAVKKLLENPTPESAAALLKDLPSLLPDDPALAAVIAEEMAKAFSTDGRGRSPSAPQSNKDGVCTSPNGPAGFQSPTCPGKSAPHNDGKIDFRGNAKAKVQADGQAKDLGYSGIDDLMQKSTSVPKEKIDSILEGGNFTCDAHEAIATLRTLSVIDSNVKNGKVKLSERAIRHYVCGERRHNRGEPEVGRLCSLPQAIDAVKHSDSRHWELDNKPVVVFDGETP